MTGPQDDWTRKLLELRTSFDDVFAAPAQTRVRTQETLLAITTAGTPLALRTAELTRVETRRKIVPVSTAASELSGLAGVRGRLVPVYNLALLLGLPRDDDERWLALCSAENQPIALAFAELEGHAEVAPGDFFSAPDDARPSAHATQLVRLRGSPRALVSVPSITRAIQARITATQASAGGASRATKERQR